MPRPYECKRGIGFSLVTQVSLHHLDRTCVPTDRRWAPVLVLTPPVRDEPSRNLGDTREAKRSVVEGQEIGEYSAKLCVCSGFSPGGDVGSCRRDTSKRVGKCRRPLSQDSPVRPYPPPILPSLLGSKEEVGSLGPRP